jgi:hypothetical protein
MQHFVEQWQSCGIFIWYFCTTWFSVHSCKQCVSSNNKRGNVQGGSNMTGTNCDLFPHKSSRSYLNHLEPIMWHCDTFASCLHLLDYPKSLIPFHSKRVLFWQFKVTDNNKMYLGPHIKYLTFFPNFNQIFNFLTDFHTSCQYSVWQKSFQWELRLYMWAEEQTDGWTDMR